jgi:hypothetical protein
VWRKKRQVVECHVRETWDTNQGPVVLVGTVQCKIPREMRADGKCPVNLASTSHAPSVIERSEEINSKRQHLWSRAGSKIVRPGFSDVPGLVQDR